MRGFRGRLLATLVGLVALTSIVLGAGAYAYVATSLRDQQLAEARAQTNFNVAILADEALPSSPTRDDLVASGLLEAFQLRGGAGTVADFGGGDPVVSGFAVAGAFERLSPELRAIVVAGSIGFERLEIEGRPFLVTAARRPPNGPDFYFFFDAAATEDAIARLGQALLVGGLVLVAIAVGLGRAVTRGVLAPVRAAGGAAERIAAGDLTARLDETGGDEFGAWAASFNRMAASLDATVAELREAEARERRFVADVSHELRTPITALVGEAAMLAANLDALPAESRRAGELLVGDVARLRALVDDLMEISRFDAAAEVAETSETDLSELVRAIATARAPEARLVLPSLPIVILTDRRRIERILANLLDNAREHGAAAEVTVEVAMAADGAAGAGPGRAGGVADPGAAVAREVVIAVEDRGPGVPAAELPRLFDRFRKADPSRHAGGSGLGLAIAREHAELLGGTLAARLRDGGGLRFELRLPVAQPLPAGDGAVTPDDEAAR